MKERSMKERSMKRTHNPTVVPSLTLHPGDVLSIPLSGTMELARI
jgi:hypothetical protein